MFVEKLEDLPETMRADFVASEFNGKKGFQHKDTVAVANAMRNAKTERDDIKTQFTALETRLAEFETGKAAEIEAARADALEKARTNGDVKVIEQRYQQQMDDLKTRSDTEIESWKVKYSDLKGLNTKTTIDSLVSGFAQKMATDNGAAGFRRLLRDRISIDEVTGKEIYLDENGGATSLDKAGFELDITKDPMFAPLMKSGIVTDGGVNLNGGGGGATTNKKFNELSGAELKEINQRDPARYQRLKTEYHNSK